MSYPRQSTVLPRLERESRRAIRALEDRHLQILLDLWEKMKYDLKANLLAAYHNHFPSENWNATQAHLSGTLNTMEAIIKVIVEGFASQASFHWDRALKQIKTLELKRALWILDQTTPTFIFPKLPKNQILEAERQGAPATSWMKRLTDFTSAYASSLHQNIKLGALNDSSSGDVADEVDATRVGTPSFDMKDLISRLYTTAAIAIQAEAREDVADVNQDIIQEEIWQTMEDSYVCPICEPNFGLSREEVDNDIPAHPNCRCFWRIVPKQWADLLKSGSDADRDLAIKMDEKGLVDDAMAVAGPDGQPVANVTISFDQWNPSTEEARYQRWRSEFEKEYGTGRS